MYINFFKRLLDFLLAGLGFIFLFPLFFTVAIVLFFLNNGKVFFFQPRPGENEKIFNVIKFKSMTDKKDANGELLPFHLRVTKFGNFIRKY